MCKTEENAWGSLENLLFLQKIEFSRDNLHENVNNLVILAKNLRENGNVWTKFRVFWAKKNFAKFLSFEKLKTGIFASTLTGLFVFYAVSAVRTVD